MQPYINSKGSGVVYVFAAPAFRQRWPVRLNLIDTNSWRGGGAAQNITCLCKRRERAVELPPSPTESSGS